jgi:hypothetical protein
MSLCLQDGIGEEALEALGKVVDEAVDEVSDEVSNEERCIQAWRRQIALLSEHGVGEKVSKAVGEAVGEEDGGCRILGSCSVRDSWILLSGMLLVLPESWILLSGMLLVLPESWILLSGMLLIPPESWMLLVDMFPIQQWISSGQQGVYCKRILMVLVRLRKCAVQ